MNINTRIIALSILLAFTVAAVFGLYIMFSGHAGHATDCPLMPGAAVFCANFALVHITHWQSAFTAMFAEVLLLIALAFLCVGPELSKFPDRQRVRLRTREREPDPQISRSATRKTTYAGTRARSLDIISRAVLPRNPKPQSARGCIGFPYYLNYLTSKLWKEINWLSEHCCSLPS